MKPAQLITDANGQTLSHNKLWANVAYLAATVCFIRYNWLLDTPNIELWLLYMGTLAGSTRLSKYLSLRFGAQTGRYDRNELNDNIESPS